MDREVPASLWRGGTSRGVFFAESDLADFSRRQVQAVLLAALGSPDPDGRQVDGLGGGASSLSKAVIVGRAPVRSGADVAYRFAQVEVTEPIVDFAGNCGNISSAVVPFAISAGLLAATEPATSATVLSLNTGQRLQASVPVRNGGYDPTGDFEVSGVPGTGARLSMKYLDAEGSASRGALPTGRVSEEVRLPDGLTAHVTIVDVGNPSVFVRAHDLGCEHGLFPLGAVGWSVHDEQTLLDRLEHIRREAAVRIGLASSHEQAGRKHRAIPKVALVAGLEGPALESWRSSCGERRGASQADLLVRLISMGVTHRTIAMTAAMAAGAAAVIPGSVVEACCRWPGNVAERRSVAIGHPAGLMSLDVSVSRSAGGVWRVPRLKVDRTAREIMRGRVFVPDSYLTGRPWFAAKRPD